MQWWQVKRVVNAVNGSSLLGHAVARAGRATVASGPRGLRLATGCRVSLPGASAFTVGNVVLTRYDAAWLDSRPRLLVHEERHTWQYVACLGLPMLPLYLVAAGYSYLRGGDFATHNPFEVTAGLVDAGYPRLSRRERARLAGTAPAT